MYVDIGLLGMGYYSCIDPLLFSNFSLVCNQKRQKLFSVLEFLERYALSLRALTIKYTDVGTNAAPYKVIIVHVLSWAILYCMLVVMLLCNEHV